MPTELSHYHILIEISRDLRRLIKYLLNFLLADSGSINIATAIRSLFDVIVLLLS